jgi:cell wall-associated NlpC family hydrolase
MNRFKSKVAFVVLLTFSVMLTAPAVPAAAAPLSGLTAPTVSEKGSGFNVVNMLLAFLFGKLFNGLSEGSGSDIAKVLGMSTAPAANAPAASAGDGHAVVTTAQKYMGVPYVWGGETPDGFDCSGFTQYVMKANGITLPRTAAEQYATGTPVEKAALQEGDLVFFTTYKPGASHVGFYMGNGKFIHASSSAAKVTISELDDPFFSAHYIGARRY